MALFPVALKIVMNGRITPTSLVFLVHHSSEVGAGLTGDEQVHGDHIHC